MANKRILVVDDDSYVRESTEEILRRKGYQVDTSANGKDALVLLDEASGAVQLAKISSTPRDPSISFLDVVARGLRDSAYEPEACVHLVHGTTVATNTIIEGKGATTALISTAGFRDIFEIGRQIRPRLYDLFVDKPPPLIPRRLCFEVPERLAASGRVLTPPDERAVLDTVPHLRSAGVESVVITSSISELMMRSHPRSPSTAWETPA